MRKFRLRTFWIVLFLVISIFLLAYLIAIYNIEHNKLLNYQKESTTKEIESLAYDLSLMIDRNGAYSVVEYLDTKKLQYDQILSLSLVYNENVILSSNRKYIGEKEVIFDDVYFIDFKNSKKFVCEKVIHVDLQTKDIVSKNHYSLFIELDQNKLNKILSSKLNYYLFMVLFISIASLASIMLIVNKFIINPIILINKKITEKNYTYSDFLLIDINNIDINLVDNIKQIEEQIYIDELTQLNNRKAYNKKLGELLVTFKRYKSIFSIMMYDIDDFKMVNDRYGHDIGDELLYKMSKLIKSSIRESDYIFRIGGEEFIILFAEMPLKESIKVAEKIRRNVEKNLKLVKNKKITISIGLTQVQMYDDEDSIYKRVDRLMYISKKEGKNRITTG